MEAHRIKICAAIWRIMPSEPKEAGGEVGVGELAAEGEWGAWKAMFRNSSFTNSRAVISNLHHSNEST